MLWSFHPLIVWPYFLLAILAASQAPPSWKLSSSVKADNAGFVSTGPYPFSAGPAIFLTQFSGFGKDYVSIIPDASKLVSGGAAVVNTLSSAVVWPNEFEPVPAGVLPAPLNVSGITCGGFIPPTKSTGAIQLLDLTQPGSFPFTISKPLNGFFYHKTYFLDVNGDGFQDVMAARTNFPTSAPPTGQLVYLPQPSPFSAPWEELVLVEGPDVFFTLYDVDGDGMLEVLAAQFFAYPGLWLYWCDESTWAECGKAGNVQKRLIDDTIGSCFSVSVGDLNLDGSADVLVTNNAADGSGGVFIYEIPASNAKSTGAWTKHVIYTGFVPMHPRMQGAGAPGNSMIAFPYSNPEKNQGIRPSLLVSGDDMGNTVLFTPNSNNSSDWTYSMTTLYQASGTTGEATTADLNGDGVNEIVVAQYAEGSVQVFVSNA